jgi:hypothetical protein
MGIDWFNDTSGGYDQRPVASLNPNTVPVAKTGLEKVKNGL